MESKTPFGVGKEEQLREQQALEFFIFTACKIHTFVSGRKNTTCSYKVGNVSLLPGLPARTTLDKERKNRLAIERSSHHPARKPEKSFKFVTPGYKPTFP